MSCLFFVFLNVPLHVTSEGTEIQPIQVLDFSLMFSFVFIFKEKCVLTHLFFLTSPISHLPSSVSPSICSSISLSPSLPPSLYVPPAGWGGGRLPPGQAGCEADQADRQAVQVPGCPQGGPLQARPLPLLRHNHPAKPRPLHGRGREGDLGGGVDTVGVGRRRGGFWEFLRRRLAGVVV